MRHVMTMLKQGLDMRFKMGIFIPVPIGSVNFKLAASRHNTRGKRPEIGKTAKLKRPMHKA